jgi:outer membrane protein OmpA-like peptidoglycan-associated protein
MYRRLIFLFVVITQLAFGQGTKSLLDQADKALSKGNLEKALTLYHQAEAITPQDPLLNLKLGQAYLTSRVKAKALTYLEKAFELKPTVDPDIHFYLATAYQLNSRFKKAVYHFDQYRIKNKRFATITSHKIRECELGDSLLRNPLYCTIKVLDFPVNSSFQDYGALVNEDETTLIFTSARDTTQLDKRYKSTYFEDILISKKVGDTWSSPEKIGGNINDIFHDAATYLSRDGQTLFLYYEKGNGDIYQSVRDGNNWRKPEPIPGLINSPHWETSGYLAPDGKLFFASDRPGGFGDLDLWVSEKKSDGSWGAPVNLGPEINTPADEDTPFVHEDGTLYFGSNGHLGLGSFDIFKSEWKNGKWQKVTNLGYPVNSPEYDSFFILSKDKKKGYFSSIRGDGLGEADLCMVTFMDPPPPVVVEEKKPVVAETAVEAKPIEDEFVDTMITLQKDLGLATDLVGKVIDTESTTPLKAEIILVDNKLNKIVARVYTNPTTGEFKITIPHGGNYGINTSAEGYLFNSLNFEVPAFSEHQELETHILMQKVEVGSKVVMKNIFFETGKAELQTESIGELERILDLLQRQVDIKIQVNGHTDNAGDDKFNKVLSLKRAEAVMSFLIQRGVDPARLRAVGYGEERPIVSNDDEQGGREINRRTEIEVFEASQKG